MNIPSSSLKTFATKGSNTTIRFSRRSTDVKYTKLKMESVCYFPLSTTKSTWSNSDYKSENSCNLDILLDSSESSDINAKTKLAPVVDNSPKDEDNTEAGLFTKVDIPSHSIIVSEYITDESKVLDKPSKYTIQRLPGVHLDVSAPIMFTNHNYKPNCRIVFDEEKLNICALESLTDIKSGEELTFDYESTESTLSCPFVDGATGRAVVGGECTKVPSKNS